MLSHAFTFTASLLPFPWMSFVHCASGAKPWEASLHSLDSRTWMVLLKRRLVRRLDVGSTSHSVTVVSVGQNASFGMTVCLECWFGPCRNITKSMLIDHWSRIDRSSYKQVHDVVPCSSLSDSWTLACCYEREGRTRSFCQTTFIAGSHTNQQTGGPRLTTFIPAHATTVEYVTTRLHVQTSHQSQQDKAQTNGTHNTVQLVACKR